MIDTKDIINMARHVLRRGQGIPDRRIMHPVRDWFIGVSVLTVLFIGGATYAGFLFAAVSDDRGPNVSTDETVATYEQEIVLEALERYRQRTERFEELRADRSNAGAELLLEEGADPENATSTDTGAGAEDSATSSEPVADGSGEQ